MLENKKPPEMFSDDLSDIKQIILNYHEDLGFVDILDDFANKKFLNTGPITVCKTPKVLALAGADLSLDMIINQNTFIKCMSAPNRIHHGHNLDRDIFKYLIFELRTPVMLLKGSKDNTVVVVTDLKDRENRPIIITVAFNRKCQHHTVNQITSAYGRCNFENYITRQFEAGNVLAINKNKVNQLFQSAGHNWPIEETPINFDNSIAYTIRNVKGFQEEKPKNFSKQLEINKVAKELNEMLSTNKDIIDMIKFFDYAGSKIYTSALWHQFQQDKKYLKSNGMVARLESIISEAEQSLLELAASESDKSINNDVLYKDL